MSEMENEVPSDRDAPSDERQTSPMVERVTMKEMCETIERSGILKRPDGTSPTAEEIYRYSPTGELFMVFAWYDAAKAIGSTP